MHDESDKQMKIHVDMCFGRKERVCARVTAVAVGVGDGKSKCVFHFLWFLILSHFPLFYPFGFRIEFTMRNDLDFIKTRYVGNLHLALYVRGLQAVARDERFRAV